MDLTDVPAKDLTVLVDGDRVCVYAPGRPGLVLTRDQVAAIAGRVNRPRGASWGHPSDNDAMRERFGLPREDD